MTGAAIARAELGRDRRSVARAFGRDDIRWGMAIAAITGVALALRLVLLRDSLLGDELFLFRIVHDRSLAGVLHVVRATEKTPPLVFVLTWLTQRIGDPTLCVRLPSLIFGTALVPLAYALGVRTVGRASALVGAAMLALTPFQILYSTEARAYAAVACLTALSTVCLLRALDGRSRRWWAGYVLAAAAALYSHYVCVFFLVPQAGWVFAAHREHLRELLVVHALIALAFAPWLPSYLLQQSHSGDEARRIAALFPPTVGRFATDNARALLGHPFVPLKVLPGTAWVALAGGVIALALAVAGARALRRGGWAAVALRSPVLLLVLLAVGTPAGIALLSVRPHMSFILPRNLIAAAVPVALLVARLLTGLRGRAAGLAIAAVVLAIAVGAVKGFESGSRRTPYRSAAQFIDERGHAGDPVIQRFLLFGGPGPLRDVLKVNLRKRYLVVQSTQAEDVAWSAGRRTGHVFLVQPLDGPLKAVRQLPGRSGPGGGFRRVAQSRYLGISDLLVAEYRYDGG